VATSFRERSRSLIPMPALGPSLRPCATGGQLELVLLGHQEAFRRCDQVETVRSEQPDHSLGFPAGQRSRRMDPGAGSGRLDRIPAGDPN